jgi:glutamyl/glutaminyl-tRNA synthetase
MNGQYLKKMKLSALTNLAVPHLLETGLLTPLEAEEWVTADRRVVQRTYLEKATGLAQPRLTFTKDIVPENEYFFNEPAYELPLLQWKKKGEAHARTHLVTVREFLASLSAHNFNLSQLEMRIKEMIQSKGLGTGDVLWPLRAALTGREKSPSPFEVMEVLGKEETIKRVDRAIERLTST